MEIFSHRAQQLIRLFAIPSGCVGLVGGGASTSRASADAWAALVPGKMKTGASFSVKSINQKRPASPMDIMSIAFYVILFAHAFMIARIIMRIMRGY
jgi:hypothetical protein